MTTNDLAEFVAVSVFAGMAIGMVLSVLLESLRGGER